MKPIMSFWSVPFAKGFHNKWINDDAWYLSWALSVAAATRSYGKPTLYTDDAGAELLVGKMKLDFADVKLDLNAYKDYDPTLTTIGRAVSAKSQVEPFIHFDYDAYIWEPIPNEYLATGIFYLRELGIRNEPKDTVRVSPVHRPEVFQKLISGLPPWWDSYCIAGEFKVYQAGIFGGSNVAFFQEWASLVMNLAQENKYGTWSALNKYARSLTADHKDPLARSYGFVPAYTLDEYLPACMAARLKLNPRFLVNQYGMTASRLTHVATDKSRHAEMYGRLLARVQKEDAKRLGTLISTGLIKGEMKQYPRVTVAILPRRGSSVYDTVLRCIVPRKLQPDQVLIINNGLSSTDINLLSKIKEVKMIDGHSVLNEDSFIRTVREHANGDLIIFVDGNIKVPKLYIEKTIASYLEHPNALFCSAAADYDTKNVALNELSYGGRLDANGRILPILSTEEAIKLVDPVPAMYGGFYAIPRSLLDMLTKAGPANFVELSVRANKRNIDVRCIKNLVVSHAYKTPIIRR